VPPEQLLLASLLQAFYGIRSERLLLEQLHYNLLFRWFVGLSPDDPIWHPTTFTKNRERLLNDDVMGRFLEKLKGAPEVKPLLSDEHLLVDGTLLQAWASHASLERIDGEKDPPGSCRMPRDAGDQGVGTPRIQAIRTNGSRAQPSQADCVELRTKQRPKCRGSALGGALMRKTHQEPIAAAATLSA